MDHSSCHILISSSTYRVCNSPWQALCKALRSSVFVNKIHWINMGMRLKFDNSWFSWIGTEVLHGAKFTGRAKEMGEGQRGKTSRTFWNLVNGNLCVWLYAANARLCDCVCECVCLSVYWCALLISRCTAHFLAHLILAGVLEQRRSRWRNWLRLRPLRLFPDSQSMK